MSCRAAKKKKQEKKACCLFCLYVIFIGATTKSYTLKDHVADKVHFK